MFVLDVLMRGGFVMFVILGVSVIGAAITLDRILALWIRGRLDTEALTRKVVSQIEAQDYRGAMETCTIATAHPLPRILKAGLAKANRREREIERAMEQEMLHAMPRLQRGVGLLGLFGNTATLLGLLGTIFGLIEAFSGVSAASASARQAVLSSGISVAMFTTAFGLVVAIPLLFAYTFVTGRIERIMIEMEEGAALLLGTLAGRMGAPTGKDR